MNPAIFHFLQQLAQNNNRDWFATHKAQFDVVNSQMREFFSEIYEGLEKHEPLEPLKIHRIYRDVRFSKDKSPYKKHFSMYAGRLQPVNRGGYYMHIEPNKSFIGGGFWEPNKEDLWRIRKEIALDGAAYEKIINDKTFVTLLGEVRGERLKLGPKDFDKNDPMIEHLKHKQFLLQRSFTNDEVSSPQFSEEVFKTFKAMRPYLDFMTQALTTNLNGESIL